MILVAIGNKPLNAAVCGLLGIFGKRVVPAHSMRDLMLCKDALQGVPHELIIEEELCGCDLCKMLSQIKQDFPEITVTVLTPEPCTTQSDLALQKGFADRRYVKHFVVREIENSMGAMV